MAKDLGSNTPTTAFGRWMVYKVIPQYYNNINGVVYMGAAILIIIVGLRGLGSIAGQLPVVPDFLLDNAGEKIDPNWVMIALFLEFVLLMILAVVTFFTPEEFHYMDEEEETAAAVAAHDNAMMAHDQNISAKQTEEIEKRQAHLKQQLESLKSMTEEETAMIDEYLNKFDMISAKISKIQMNNLDALNKMKETLKG